MEKLPADVENELQGKAGADELDVPKAIPPIEVRPLQPTSKASAEAQRIADGDYEENGRWNDFRRAQRFKETLHWIAIVGICVFALILLAAIVSFFIHMLLPERFHYLSANQLSSINTFITSGVVVGLVQNYIRKHI